MDIFIFVLSLDLDIFKKDSSFYVIDTRLNKIYEINKLINTRNMTIIKDIEYETGSITAEDWFQSSRRKSEFQKIFHIQCILDVDNANVIKPEHIEYDVVSNNFLLKKDIILNYIYYEKKLYFINNYHNKGSFLYSNCFPIIHVPFKKIIQSNIERAHISAEKIYYFDILDIDVDEHTLDYEFIVDNISFFFNQFFSTNKYSARENSPMTLPAANQPTTDDRTNQLATMVQLHRQRLLCPHPCWNMQNKTSSPKRLMIELENEKYHNLKSRILENSADSHSQNLTEEQHENTNKILIRMPQPHTANNKFSFAAALPSTKPTTNQPASRASYKPRCINMNKGAQNELMRMDPDSSSKISSYNNCRDKISEILSKNEIGQPAESFSQATIHSASQCPINSTNKSCDVKIVLITVGWNEANMLTMFLDYYSRQVDKIVYFDNQSTDNTRDVIKDYTMNAAANTCEIVVENFDTQNEIDDDQLIYLKNNEWKKYTVDFDWAIIVDVDEFIVPFTEQGLREFLASETHYGAVQSVGYQMFGSEYVFHDITRGAKYEQYDKVCCWNLHRLIEINYCHGSHRCSPQFAGANTQIHKCACQLRHMKFVGELDDLCKRVAEYQKRLCSKNKKNNWGNQYSISFFKKSYLYFSRKLTDVC